MSFIPVVMNMPLKALLSGKHEAFTSFSFEEEPERILTLGDIAHRVALEFMDRKCCDRLTR